VAATRDLRALRSIADRAARLGGEVVRSGIAERAAEEKGAGDYVTQVDLSSEQAIAGFLERETPDIPILGEEEGGRGWDEGGLPDEEPLLWVVDPLDGTTNFVHGFPAVGVSVALIDEGRPLAGAVHAPFLGETFIAARGEGAFAFRDGREPARMGVSSRQPDRAIVTTGFPYRQKGLLPRYLSVMNAALVAFEDLRRPGAASLDLAWVAAGIFEGFFELGLSAWDVAAGALLVEEAGGLVTDWDGAPEYLNGDILAGSPAVHEELQDLATRSSAK
jgi:myo-inositol-1(or 4)-monophosphatase